MELIKLVEVIFGGAMLLLSIAFTITIYPEQNMDDNKLLKIHVLLFIKRR